MRAIVIIKRYILIYYFDVCGNKEDGWVTNNSCQVSDIDIEDNITDEGILDLLHILDFIETIEQVEVQHNRDNIKIVSKKNGYPLYGLSKIFEYKRK